MTNMISLARLHARYRTLFSIKEIEETPILQWFFGAMLLFFYVSFGRFITVTSSTIEAAAAGTSVCWPYFQSCTKLFFLSALPEGYTQSMFYMVLYGIMLLIVYLMWKRAWVHAHFLMTVLWLWKMFVIFVLSYLTAGPYDYYHVILTAVLLFVPHKEYFAKLTFVFLYFMSVTPKFDATWVLGSYFTAMKTGLPLFPTELAPIFSNFVIFFQVVGCWFLLSANRLYQRTALVCAVFFHLYSGILVFYMYPTIALPPLLILFGPLYRYTPTPFARKALAGVFLLLVVAVFQLLGFVIPSDRRVTLEGNRFGMFMFEANHQCIVSVQTVRESTRVETAREERLSCGPFYCLTETRTFMEKGAAIFAQRYESASAWGRCDPYPWWVSLGNRCASDPTISRISLQFDHSINGGPFYRIVEEADICDVAYRPFVHNAWIKEPPEAPAIGRPVQNFY